MSEVEETAEDPIAAKGREAAKIYKEKKSLDAVAEAMGVHESTVRYYLVNTGFKDLRPQGAPRNEDVRDEVILELRDDHNLSFADIAREVGMSKAGVYARYREITTGERPMDRTRPPKKPRKPSQQDA
ncbi:AsnC family protein [Nonomuraea sp. SYSU D8015]|uniref:AsnC family protein n=1 Tax=Nonomuraea sp. SYSU D8015 TaxID=2593644 RepID=UPI0016615B53|nr:AsnC family protein [Nonomuraea sp. SYSU D8015]